MTGFSYSDNLISFSTLKTIPRQIGFALYLSNFQMGANTGFSYNSPNFMYIVDTPSEPLIFTTLGTGLHHPIYGNLTLIGNVNGNIWGTLSAKLVKEGVRISDAVSSDYIEISGRFACYK